MRLAFSAIDGREHAPMHAERRTWIGAVEEPAQEERSREALGHAPR